MLAVPFRAVIPVGVLAVCRVVRLFSVGRMVAVLLGALACGTVIYGSLWVATASVSFCAVASREAVNSITYGGRDANEYPLHIYRNWIRATLGWGIPLAFVAYVPSQWLLDADDPLGLPDWLVVGTPLVTVALTAVSIGIWTIGIRHYQSTGS